MLCGETSSAHDVVPICARIHAHSAAKIRRQIRSLPLCFFVTRRLGIYCFNLPWLCLIMESSFWPARRQRAARPLKQTFLCLCFTEVKRCFANRLWIRTVLSLRRCSPGVLRYFLSRSHAIVYASKVDRKYSVCFWSIFYRWKDNLTFDLLATFGYIDRDFNYQISISYLNFVIIIVISWLTLHLLCSTHWSASVNKSWNKSS